MPRISSFYGITIAMYYDEAHHDVAHFRAAYAEHRASVSLDGAVIAGGLPRRALELVREWAALHRSELAANWGLARRGVPLASIDPLP
jgi:hypothetical protein